MSFQILDSQKQPIIINELDKEAAEFWQIPVDPRMYAKDWFDIIGYRIHNPIDPRYTSGWNNVKHNMLLVSVGGLYEHIGNPEAMTKAMEGIHKFLKPYFDLIDHWAAKGYTPLKID